MKLIIFVVILSFCVMPVTAVDISAPTVPEAGEEYMPQSTNFAEGLQELLRSALGRVRPDLAEASKVCLSLIAAVFMVSILQSFSGMAKTTTEFAGAVTVATVLLLSTNSMIRLGSQTVTELSAYGKLLLPVMTAALAAQGGVTSSAALYGGTSVFIAVLGALISNLLVPLVYLYLALATANCAMGEDVLKKMRDFLKWLISWCLKTMLTVFTTYMGITGVITGTTDAAALKATKMTISSFVPVVGSILSEASEAVLVSAGIAKNAAGIYGIFAILALFLEPFLRIGAHYLMLKLTAAVCNVFGEKRATDLIEDFSSAMGFLLGMTGSICLLLLISTVCFLKGAA
ncbi:MAG: hypothetical protein U0L15_03590 [Oscillospiraceae bacterium]|nr:hypothetical protein [Oscillospiraceae bacterium]